MGSSIYFPLSAIPFCLLLVVLCFFKKTINSAETKIYKYLVVINMIGLLLELFCTYASVIRFSNPLLSDFILKSYLVYNVIWTFILTVYVFFVSRQHEDEKKNKKIKKISIIAIIIAVIIVYALKCNLIVSDDFAVRYTNGPSVIFTYTLCGIFIIGMIFLILNNIHNLNNKKYIPIYSFLVTIIFGIILQMNFPGILIMTFIETLTLNIMYFTIENPDLKMIEELQKTRKLNEKANNDKSNFLFNMTQDVRQPIERVKEICDIAILENDPEVLKEGIREIKSVSNEFDRLINNVLDVSSIDAKNLKLSNNKYNIYKLLKSVSLGIKSNINKDVDFRTSFNENIPDELYGDDIKLKQILTTVLSNSSLYTKEGFIDFRVDSIKKHNICRLIITIEDSGEGMGVRQINNILESKELSEEDLKIIDNKNVNLNVVNKLVSLIGGNINIESHEGKGTIFTITLDQKIYEEDDMFSNYKTKKKILLVIEDDELDKEFEKNISKEKYQIQRVNMAKTCLDMVRSGEEYDLIVVEQDMSKINHKQLIGKLKDIEGFNSNMILLGDSDLSVRQEILEMGYKVVIDKSINKEEINKVINE